MDRKKAVNLLINKYENEMIILEQMFTKCKSNLDNLSDYKYELEKPGFKIGHIRYSKSNTTRKDYLITTDKELVRDDWRNI